MSRKETLKMFNRYFEKFTEAGCEMDFCAKRRVAAGFRTGDVRTSAEELGPGPDRRSGLKNFW